MSEILMNFSSGVLSAAPGAAGVTLTSGNFAFLPLVAAPHTMRIALDPDGIAGTPEIVTVTAHAAAALTVTVLRGQETAYGAGPARAHAIDTVWRQVLTRASIIEMTVPAASVIATTAATPDPGYVFIDGSTITNGQVVYPATWARIPASWKAAPDIVMPDWRGRTLFSDDAGAVFTLGASAGANTHAITQAELPAATITIDPPALTIDPPATAVTGTTSQETDPHVHVIAGYSGPQSLAPGVLGPFLAAGPDRDTGPNVQHHAHTGGSLAVDIAPFNVDQAPFASGPLGSGTAMSLLPAHGVVNWALKVH